MSTLWPTRCPSQPRTSSTTVRTPPACSRTARTVTVRHSVPLIALLLPGIAAVVIAVDLPVAGPVGRQQLERAHPLRALPEVQMRDEQSRRAAVRRLERLAVVLPDQPRLPAGQVGERQVGL